MFWSNKEKDNYRGIFKSESVKSSSNHKSHPKCEPPPLPTHENVQDIVIPSWEESLYFRRIRASLYQKLET